MSRAWLVPASLGLFAALAAAPCLWAPLFDDAYIHARLAEQLLETGRPDFNPGAGLKTGSSTGYLLLLAALTAITRDALLALRAIQTVTVALYVLAYRHLALALRGRLGWPELALLVVALPPVAWAAYGGMETSTAALCLVSSASSAARGRDRTALSYASLAAGLRPELLLFAAYLAGRWRWQGARVGSLLLALAPLFGCALFDLYAYGTLVPQAAAAKSLAYHLPWPEAAQLAFGVSFERYALPLASLYIAALALRARSAAALGALDGLWLQTVALLTVWTLSRSIMFPWYVAGFATCISVLALAVTQGRARLLALASCALSAALGVLSLRAVWVDLGLAHEQLASGARAQRYLSLAGPLYDHCPRCTLASSEIGALGYAFRGTVYDAIGLADGAALAFHPLSVPEQRSSYRVGAIPPGYIARRAPDFVVSMPLFSEALRGSPVRDDFVVYDCPLVPAQPARQLWGDRVIQVFARSPLPAAVLARMQCAATP